jgi:hypothetical protein
MGISTNYAYTAPLSAPSNLANAAPKATTATSSADASVARSPAVVLGGVLASAASDAKAPSSANTAQTSNESYGVDYYA